MLLCIFLSVSSFQHHFFSKSIKLNANLTVLSFHLLIRRSDGSQTQLSQDIIKIAKQIEEENSKSSIPHF